MAGSLAQCPRCGRLNDVPRLSDLHSLADDGTIVLQPVEEKEEDIHRLDKLHHIFANRRVDDRGEEIDLRVTMDDIEKAGVDEVPLVMKDELRPTPPRYDPVTGELVRPIDLKKEGRPAFDNGIPLAAPALAYASTGVVHALTPARTMLELFMPVNMVVMLFIFLGHLVVGLISILLTLLAAYLGMPAWWLIVPFMYPFMAHYATVIEDTGPEARDELPRPFRNLSWSDDICGPMLKFMICLLYCYAPVIVAMAIAFQSGWWNMPVLLALAAAGSLLVPAVMMGFVTTGAIATLSPFQIAKVIARCGPRYILPAVTWMIAFTLYLWMGLGIAPPIPPDIQNKVLPFVGVPLTLIAIYLMHWYCWQIGLLYGMHHEEFHWVFRRISHSQSNRAAMTVLPDDASRAIASSAASRRGRRD